MNAALFDIPEENNNFMSLFDPSFQEKKLASLILRKLASFLTIDFKYYNQFKKESFV